MAFEAINTQEEFDSAIKDRLARERAKYSDYDELKKKVAQYEANKDKYADYDDVKQQLADYVAKEKEHASDIKERDEKIAKYEHIELQRKVAHEVGIPDELAERLNGNDEKALKSDAELLKKLVGKRSTPAAQAERGEIDKDAGLRSLAKALTSKE